MDAKAKTDESMLGAVARLLRKMPARRRAQLPVVIAVMICGALAEVMTLGAMLPFLGLVAGSDVAADHPRLAALLGWLGLGDTSRLLIPATLLFAFVAVAAGVVRVMLTWVNAKFVFGLGHDFGVEVYRRILHQPYSYHIAHNTSEVIGAKNKVQLVTQAVVLPLMQSVSAAIIGLCIVATLIVVDPVISLTAFAAFSIIYAGVILTAQRRLRANSKAISLAQGRRVQTVQEGLGGIRDVLIDKTQALFIRRFSVIDRSLRSAQASNLFLAGSPRFIVESAGMVLIAVLALQMSGRPGGLTSALPVLGALAVGAQRLLPLMQLIYTARAQLAGNWHVIDDVARLLEIPVDETQTAEEGPPLPFARDLALENVSFAYQPDAAPVVRKLNLVIRKGSKVGFIGETGSGKSTTIDLIMGLLQPTSGAVLVDGLELDAANRRAWQRRIAHVPQAIFLSDASIAENIAFGVPVIDHDRVRQAAAKAAMAEFIEALPEGYGTRVGERGVRLSGGQRQRIGIARALYKRADVLVFDEATSALDVDTEGVVMEAIAGLGQDLTVILIAHRLSTVAVCDQVARLKNGRIVEVGDYETVLAKAPAT